MKNTIKILETLSRWLCAIALAAVIGFGVVSCGDDDDDDTISGNNIVSGADVVYYSDIEDLDEAKKATDFSFCDYWDEENDYYYEEKPLSFFLDGTSSVTVNNNKVTIILGTPKSSFLHNFDWLIIEGVTVNPSNAKIFEMGQFFTSGGEFYLDCLKGNFWDGDSCGLVYVDKDVTINGTYYSKDDKEASETNYKLSLKKGWNYVVYSYNEKTDIGICTSFITQPSGFKWTVSARGGNK